jgi:hypothetical protein
MLTNVLAKSEIVKNKFCFETTIKFYYNGKLEFEKNQLCRKSYEDKKTFYISKSCVNDQCEILKRAKKPIEIKDYISNLGSPGFKLCFALDGVPQIFEFENQQKKWLSSERCIFKNNDFVEISLLSREWKNLINPTN